MGRSHGHDKPPQDHPDPPGPAGPGPRPRAQRQGPKAQAQVPGPGPGPGPGPNSCLGSRAQFLVVLVVLVVLVQRRTSFGSFGSFWCFGPICGVIVTSTAARRINAGSQNVNRRDLRWRSPSNFCMRTELSLVYGWRSRISGSFSKSRFKRNRKLQQALEIVFGAGVGGPI